MEDAFKQVLLMEVSQLSGNLHFFIMEQIKLFLIDWKPIFREHTRLIWVDILILISCLLPFSKTHGLEEVQVEKFKITAMFKLSILVQLFQVVLQFSIKVRLDNTFLLKHFLA